MDIRNGLVGSIGNTALIELRTLSDRTGCTSLGKAEFLDPGGSVKDRAARYIIEDAEAHFPWRRCGSRAARVPR